MRNKNMLDARCGMTFASYHVTTMVRYRGTDGLIQAREALQWHLYPENRRRRIFFPVSC